MKSDSDLSPEERLTLHIHMTMTGQPEDSQYVDQIVVDKEFTLKDLKDVILSMPSFDFAKEFVTYQPYYIV